MKAREECPKYLLISRINKYASLWKEDCKDAEPGAMDMTIHPLFSPLHCAKFLLSPYYPIIRNDD